MNIRFWNKFNFFLFFLSYFILFLSFLFIIYLNKIKDKIKQFFLDLLPEADELTLKTEGNENTNTENLKKATITYSLISALIIIPTLPREPSFP